MFSRKINSVAWVLAACVCVAFVSTGTSEEDAMVITSEQLEYDYQRGIAVFKQDVLVQDKDIRMVADELRVFFDEANNVRSFAAIGNVTIQSDESTGSCKKAIYLVAEKELILIGDAKIARANDFMTGSRITFWRDEDRILCENAHIVFLPKQNDSEQ